MNIVEKLIQRYNALDGKTVSWKELSALHTALFDNLPLEVPQIREMWENVGKLLEHNSKATKFEITVKTPIKLPKESLNAPRHKGLAKQGLSECGRLKKGYKYEKGGKIVKITPKKIALKKRKTTTKKRSVQKQKSTKIVSKKNKITPLVKSKLSNSSKRKVYYPTINNVRFGRTNFTRKWEAEKQLKSIINNHSEEKLLKLIATNKTKPTEKQLALFGGKKKVTPKRKPRRKKIVGAVQKRAPLSKGLGAPVPQINGLQSVANRSNAVGQTYNITGDIATLLGNVEIKPKGSVAVTLDAPQGAGKTRAFFQIINEFAKNYKVLFVSAEEHPQSALFNNKLDQYVASANQQNVFAIDETNFDVIKQHIPNFDVIFIDSWNKIAEKNNVDFDFNLRKGFDSKLFFAIFQRTQDGKMRGGSKAQFDGDIILKIPKQDDFKDNFIIADKNRYQDKPIEELKYNIYHQRLSQGPVSSNIPITASNEPIILEV